MNHPVCGSLPADGRCKIKNAFHSLNLKHTDEKIEKLIGYLDLLNRWNQKMNLTSIDPEDQINRIIIESAVLTLFFPDITPGMRAIDLGTGAGIPGMILAILYPEIAFVLIDSKRKKTMFLEESIQCLDIRNISVVWNRIESLDKGSPDFYQKYDIITARALGAVDEIAGWGKHLLSSGGRCILPRGQSAETEWMNFIKRANREWQGSLREVRLPQRDAPQFFIVLWLREDR